MAKREDLTGQRFGRLVVQERLPKNDGHVSWWLCKCDCGNVKQVRGSCLKRGDTKSCGCLSRELASERGKSLLRKHGWYGTRLYGIWHNIVDRCSNPKSLAYKHYGGRGIKMCKEWRENPSTFCEWAVANGYADNLTIDRIDNNKDYKPSNCRWVTNNAQQVNKRNNVTIEYNGKRQCVAEWARELDLDQSKIYRLVAKYGTANAEKVLFG